MIGRTAIFDLDGTLADTAPDLVGALNRVLAEDGLAPAPLALFRSVAGRGGRALLEAGHRRAGQPLDAAAIEAKLPRFLEHYAAALHVETRLFEGVAAALDQLAAAGWRLGVCTNKPERMARPLIESLGLSGHFGEAVIGADTLPVRKPDPRPVFESIARAGGEAQSAVMIGDTITDRDAARNAEIPVILVSFGYAPDPVATLAPDAIADTASALPTLLTNLLTREEP